VIRLRVNGKPEEITFRADIPYAHKFASVMPDLRLTRQTLAGTGLNPNCGAVIVVDHHRETGSTAEDLAADIAKSGKRVEAVNIRESGGAIEATARVL
jgi:altronate dehydratase